MRHRYVVNVRATSMRPNQHHVQYQLRVLPVLDNDRMAQILLKQELVAHQVAAKNVSRPGA